MSLLPNSTAYSHLDGNGPEAENGHVGTPKPSEDLQSTLDAELDDIESDIHFSKALSDPKSPVSTSRPNPALFLLHANTITGLIGIATICLLWIPIPFLHWFGWETFELPLDGTMYAAVAGVCFCGVVGWLMLMTNL